MLHHKVSKYLAEKHRAFQAIRSQKREERRERMAAFGGQIIDNVAAWQENMVDNILSGTDNLVANVNAWSERREHKKATKSQQ